MPIRPVAPHPGSRSYVFIPDPGRAVGASCSAAITRLPLSNVRWDVEDLRSWDEFLGLEREWNELVSATDNQIFFRHEFVRVWCDAFLADGRLRVLALRSRTGALEALLPLIERRSVLYGVPVRELASPSNDHSCRFDLVARDAEEAAAAFYAHLRNDPFWDVLRLNDVPEGGKARALLRTAAAAGDPTGAWPFFRSPYAPLPAVHAELLGRLDAKFKANLRRRRRRLEERGQVSIERVQGGVGLNRHLEQGLVLEQSGWKGRGGTAIAQDRATLGFYTELAQAASQMSALSLWFLRLDGQAIAFQYGLEYAGRYLLLKPAYDERFKEYGPGQLLTEAVFEHCVQRRLAEFDFLGHGVGWKLNWTDRVRPHDWLYVFRNTPKGRALCRAKFKWAPVAKRFVARWKR